MEQSPSTKHSEMHKNNEKDLALWAVQLKGATACQPVTDWEEGEIYVKSLEVAGMPAQIVPWPGTAKDFARNLVADLLDQANQGQKDLLRVRKERDNLETVLAAALSAQSPMKKDQLEMIARALASALTNLLAEIDTRKVCVSPSIEQLARNALSIYQKGAQ